MQEWRNQENYLSSSISDFLSKSRESVEIPHLKNQTLEISRPSSFMEGNILGKRIRNEQEDFFNYNETSFGLRVPSTDNRCKTTTDPEEVLSQLTETRHQLEDDYIQR
jgi:hypothetical protein